MEDFDPKELAAQLRKPEGEYGITLANELNQSNLALSEFTYDHMDLQDGDVVLEIGFGNGKLIPSIINAANDIDFVGIDISETMVDEATKYNKVYVASGMVELKVAGTDSIPYPANNFDKIATVNTLYFWDNPLDEAEEVYRVLKRGGKLCIGIRPKSESKEFEFTKHGFTLYSCEDAKNLLVSAGFIDVECFTKKEEATYNGETVTLTSLCITASK